MKPYDSIYLAFAKGEEHKLDQLIAKAKSGKLPVEFGEWWKIRHSLLKRKLRLDFCIWISVDCCGDELMLAQLLVSDPSYRSWALAEWQAINDANLFVHLTSSLMYKATQTPKSVSRAEQTRYFMTLLGLSSLYAEGHYPQLPSFCTREAFQSLILYMKAPSGLNCIADRLAVLLAFAHLQALMDDLKTDLFDLIDGVLEKSLLLDEGFKSLEWRHRMCVWAQLLTLVYNGQTSAVRRLVSADVKRFQGQGRSDSLTANWSPALPSDTCILEMKTQLLSRGILSIDGLANIALLIMRDPQDSFYEPLIRLPDDSEYLTRTACSILKNLKLNIKSRIVEKLVPTVLLHLINHSSLHAFTEALSVFRQCVIFPPLQFQCLPSIGELQGPSPRAILNLSYILCVVSFYQPNMGFKVMASPEMMSKHRDALLDYWMLLHEKLLLERFRENLQTLIRSPEYDSKVKVSFMEVESLLVSLAEPLFIPKDVFLLFPSSINAVNAEAHFEVSRRTVDWICSSTRWSVVDQLSQLVLLAPRFFKTFTVDAEYLVFKMWERCSLADDRELAFSYFVSAWVFLAKTDFERSLSLLGRLLDTPVTFRASVYDPLVICKCLAKAVLKSPDLAMAVFAALRVLMLYSRNFWNLVHGCWAFELKGFHPHLKLLELQDLSLLKAVMYCTSACQSARTKEVVGQCLHQILKDETLYIDLLCLQTFDVSCLPFAVTYIPCFHVSVNYLPKLLHSHTLEEYSFGLKLLVSLASVYPSVQVWRIVEQIFIPQFVEFAVTALCLTSGSAPDEMSGTCKAQSSNAKGSLDGSRRFANACMGLVELTRAYPHVAKVAEQRVSQLMARVVEEGCESFDSLRVISKATLESTWHFIRCVAEAAAKDVNLYDKSII